ncbi:MAG: hypothetical protein JOY71_13955 [Acetobacteraceae bacterium]|nr:hypothetical protein [Acetobacteraceae bacterium]MBV8523204.1 hypothetical protein [Acetobacteraceae bacterium]
MWYTDYARGAIGRSDPNTGQAREWSSPGGADSGPYGMTVTNDIVWYSESGVYPNTLVRFDPKTQQFQTWPIPSGGGVVRSMMATREGNLVLPAAACTRWRWLRCAEGAICRRVGALGPFGNVPAVVPRVRPAGLWR